MLHQFLFAAVKLDIDASTFWTNSIMMLHWINILPRTIKTFVVSEIQRLTRKIPWRDVLSSDNPSRCLSWGTELHSLLTRCSIVVRDDYTRENAWLVPIWLPVEVEVPEHLFVLSFIAQITDTVEFLKRFLSVSRFETLSHTISRFVTTQDPMRNEPIH